MAIDDLYDMQAFSGYLDQQRGAGLVPEFTNIPGATGFFVNDQAPPEEEVDLPDLESFTDSHSANRASLALKQEIERDKLARKEELEKEEGLSDIRLNLQSWKATGLANSDLVKTTEEELRRKEQEIQARLAQEDKNYLPKEQLAEQLSGKARELSAPRDPLAPSKIELIALKAGMQKEELELYAAYAGIDKEKLPQLAIAELTPAKKKYLRDAAETGDQITGMQVVANNPGALDLAKIKIDKAFPNQGEAALMKSELEALNKEVKDTIANTKAVVPVDAKGKRLPMSSLKARGWREEEENLIAKKAAATKVLADFSTRFRQDYLNLSGLSVVDIHNLTQPEKEILAVMAPEIQTLLGLIDNPDSTLEERLYAKGKIQYDILYNLPEATKATITAGGLGTVGVPQPDLQSILNKIYISGSDKFNKKYGNTIGITYDLGNLPKGAL